MESKFYIGQKVVVIQNFDTIIKGQIFTVLDIIESPCCGVVNIQINKIEEKITHVYCASCGGIFRNDIRIYNQNRFAPVQEISDFTYEEAIEMVSEKITI